MSDGNIVVAVYETPEDAESAVRKLDQAGFDMKKLSIVAKNPHAEEHVAGFYNTGDRIKHWGKRGAFWGSIWGLLFGSAFVAIPGLGPIPVAGPLVAWIVGGLEGRAVVGGLNAVGPGCSVSAYRKTASSNTNRRERPQVPASHRCTSRGSCQCA